MERSYATGSGVPSYGLASMTGAMNTGSVYGVPHAELSSSVTTGDIMFSAVGVPNGHGDAPWPGMGEARGELIMTDWNFFFNAASKSPWADLNFGLNGVPPGEHLNGVCFSIAFPPIAICDKTSVLIDRSGERNCTDLEPAFNLSATCTFDRFGSANGLAEVDNAKLRVGIGGGGGGGMKPAAAEVSDGGSGGGGGMFETAAATAATATAFGIVYLAMLNSSFSQTASVTLFSLQNVSTCLNKSFTLHRIWNSDGDDAFALMVVFFNVASKASIDLYLVSKACCSTLRCKMESRFAVIWFHCCTNASSCSSLSSASAASICSFSCARCASSSTADAGDPPCGGGGGGPAGVLEMLVSWKPRGACIICCCGVLATEEAYDDAYDVSPD